MASNNGLLREIRDLEKMAVQFADSPIGVGSLDPPRPPTAQIPGEGFRPSARLNVPAPQQATGFGADKPQARPGAFDPSSSVVQAGAGGSRTPIISGGRYDPALTQGSWAPYRPTPEPTPYPLEAAYPTTPGTGTASWGASGTPITAGFLIDLGEYNPAMYGQPAVALYEKMRRSIAQVWATLRAAKQPQFSAEWAVKPGTKPDEPGFAKAQEIADFVRDNLFGGLEFATSLGSMANQTWGDVIYNALLMLDFGAAVHEENWTIDGKYIKLRNLPARLPITFYRFHTESDGETLVALEQYGYRGWEFLNCSIPVNKLCRFTYNQEGGNFWGLSMQRPMYTSWYCASGLYRVTSIAAERTGCGVPVITLNEGFSEQDRLAAFNFVTQLSAHELTGMVLAPNQTFKIHGVEGQNYNVLQLIEHHLRQISMVGLQAFMTIGSAPHGSRATASVQHGFFMAASQHLADDVAESITKTTIRRLVQLNFGPDAPVPRLMASNLKAEDDSAVMQQLVTLAQSGLVLSEDNIRGWIRNALDLPEEGVKGLVLPKGETTEDEPGGPGSPGGPPEAAFPGQKSSDSEFAGAQKQGIKVNVAGSGKKTMHEIHRGGRHDQAFREMPEGNRVEAIAHLWRAEVYNSLGEDREFSCDRISEALATFGAAPLTQVEVYWIANGGAREFLGDTAPVVGRGRRKAVLRGGKYESEERRSFVAGLYRRMFSDLPQILYLSSRFERINEALRECGALSLSESEREWIRAGGVNTFVARGLAVPAPDPDDFEPEPVGERLALFDAEQPRDQSGQWTSGGRPADKARSDLARRSYKPCTAAKQKLADGMEAKVASAIGGQRTADNAPFDVISGKNAIEVKTIVEADHDKITMHPESLARKERFADEKGYRPHTVVIDARGSMPVYYHKDGLGSFRLGSMESVSLGALKKSLGS